MDDNKVHWELRITFSDVVGYQCSVGAGILFELCLGVAPKIRLRHWYSHLLVRRRIPKPIIRRDKSIPAVPQRIPNNRR